MTSPTTHETAREQEPPAPIADAEVAELVASLRDQRVIGYLEAGNRMAKAADTIARLARENNVLAGQLRYVTKANADNWDKRQQAEAERDLARATLDELIAQTQAQLSAANARAEGLQKRIDLLEDATRAGIIQDNPNE